MTLLNAHQGLPLYLMQKNSIQYKPVSGRYLILFEAHWVWSLNMILSDAHQGFHYHDLISSFNYSYASGNPVTVAVCIR